MSDIMNNLNKDGSFYKFNGIVSCVQTGKTTTEIVEKLKKLKNDSSRIAGHTIAEFSMAALDILEIEKYNGDDDSIKELIKSRFNF